MSISRLDIASVSEQERLKGQGESGNASATQLLLDRRHDGGLNELYLSVEGEATNETILANK